MNLRDQRVVVIGAGMAGLAAARRLAEAGCKVTLLKPPAGWGGRILTTREDGEIIELGAEFIHGKPPELWDLIHEAGLTTYEVDGTDAVYEDGQLQVRDEQGDVFAFLDRLESWQGPDIPFANYPPFLELDEDRQRELSGFVEGFNAADHKVIGIQALAAQQRAEEEIEGDRAFRVREGYDRVPQFLARKLRAAGGEIEFDTRVDLVEWDEGLAKIHAGCHDEGITFEAEVVVIAVPLGVLHRRALKLKPRTHAGLAG